MFTSYNYVQFLRAALLGIGILIATVNVECVLAAGIQNNGDSYDDGKLIWLRISNRMEYEKAVEFCDRQSGGGVKWKVPTSEQMKLFYKHIYSRNLKEELNRSYGWHFDWVWTSTEVPNTKRHETVLFYPLLLTMGGMEDSKSRLVTCVRPVATNFTDGLLTWSPFDSTTKSFEQAQQHCNTMGPGWRLPDKEQLQSFAKNTNSKTNIVGEYQKIASAPLWTSKGNLFNLLGTSFDKPKDEKFYVMCVKNSSRNE